jgi:hypothetical protein
MNLGDDDDATRGRRVFAKAVNELRKKRISKAKQSTRYEVDDGIRENFR